MKLRILDDSIRLRLSRAEVDAIATGDSVVSRTRFPGAASLCCTLSAGAVPEIRAALDRATVAITLPDGQARVWARSDEVSLRGQQLLDGGGTLSILIEKDFECVTPRVGESQSDRFPNPSASRPGSDQ